MQKMKTARIICCIVVFFACLAKVESNNLKAGGKNVCEIEVSYTQTFTEKKSVPKVRTYYQFCFDMSQGFRCLRHETYYSTVYVVSSRPVIRFEYTCCDGWLQDGIECTIAVCRGGCGIAGRCTLPDYCECDSGYGGLRCENDVNECLDNNGGCSDSCKNLYGSFVCACSPGYVLDGNGMSCSDHDECSSSTHGCQHRCVNTKGSYRCMCDKGYELMNDETSCREINECESNPCDQKCTDLIGSYECSCNEGYLLASDSVTCNAVCPQGCGNGGYCSSPDICTCSKSWSGQSCETPVCYPHCNNGECVSPDTCVCYTGWEGEACDDDTNECLKDNGGCDDVCTNKKGSYECSCNSGYILSENQHSCSDHNECGSSDHGCDFCVNTPGSYECVCPDGYTLTEDGKCLDINECLNSPCEQNCTNTLGSFYCTCAVGFALDVNGYRCSDIDECKENTHNCEQICVNTNSWYKCACRDGYELGSDGKTCLDVDECSDSILNSCEQECTNTVGSFHCSCSAGYLKTEKGCEAICVPTCQNGGICSEPGVCQCIAGWTGLSCEIDIDECSEGLAPCDQQCTNFPGGYLCSCSSGYSLQDAFTCVDIDECAENGTSKCQQRCSNSLGSYSCSCGEGFILDTNGFTCSDHDECLSEYNVCEYCANTQGSFSCYCPKGFSLNEDAKTCSPVCDAGCRNGGTCVAPNTCDCPAEWRGVACEWEVTKNHWTLNSTGCQCYFDHSRFDCACCNHGGCQCTDAHSDKCVQCGYGFTCEDVHDADNRGGTDGWTLSETGCPCIVNNTNEMGNEDCACCQHGGCPCGKINPHRCMQCGQPYMCSTKKPWE